MDSPPAYLGFEDITIVMFDLRVLLTSGCWKTPFRTTIIKGLRLGMQGQMTAILSSKVDQMPKLMLPLHVT